MHAPLATQTTPNFDARILEESSAADEFLEREFSVETLSGKQLETLQLRQRALWRMEELELSAARYAQLLQADRAEAEYLSPDGRFPDRATLYRWAGKAENLAALARGPGGPGRKRQIPDWLAAFVLEKMVANRKTTTQGICDKCHEFAKKLDFWVPSKATVRRFVDKLSAKGGLIHMLKAIQTRKFFSQYQMAAAHFYSHPNHIWEVDATRIGIMIKQDSGDQKPKPVWLLLTIDCYSGLAVGWTLVLGDPKQNDLIRHLAHCLDINSKKPYGGIPKILQSDNGAIFKSRVLEIATNELGIKLRKSPPYCPAYNGAIERLNQELKKSLANEFVAAVQARRMFREEDEVFLGSFEDLEATIEETLLKRNLRRRSGSKESRLAVWASNLDSCRHDHKITQERISEACLELHETRIEGRGALVKGQFFTSEAFSLSRGRKISVLCNLGNRPLFVKAVFNGSVIDLEPNDSEISKTAEKIQTDRRITKEIVSSLVDNLKNSSVASMVHHTRGSHKALLRNLSETADETTTSPDPTEKSAGKSGWASRKTSTRAGKPQKANTPSGGIPTLRSLAIKI